MDIDKFTYVHPMDGRFSALPPAPCSKIMPEQGVRAKSEGRHGRAGGRHDGALTHDFVDESGNKSRF
jgi:hypothetical protein